VTVRSGSKGNTVVWRGKFITIINRVDGIEMLETDRQEGLYKGMRHLIERDTG
jgi:hypothetical protein